MVFSPFILESPRIFGSIPRVETISRGSLPFDSSSQNNFLNSAEKCTMLGDTSNTYFMSKRKVSVEDKIYAVNLYLNGKESQRRIADMFDVSLASVQQWIRNYESMGANAFTLK